MTPRIRRPAPRPQPAGPGRRPGLGAPDATTEPDPGPAPEAVFDRLTGPYARRAAVGIPGGGAGAMYDEGT